MSHAPPLRPPSPDPFFLEGGDVGVLLVHGFSGSPSEVRRVAEHLHERGVTVSAPLLPGHGTKPADLSAITWLDWLNHARVSCDALAGRVDTVFVGGLSIGAALAAHLAAERDVRGLVAYSPAVLIQDWKRVAIAVASLILRRLPNLGKDVRSEEAARQLWSYRSYPLPAAREVFRLIRASRDVLPEVSCPVLVVRSTRDRTVPPEAGQHLYDTVASKDKEMLTLHDSGHVVTIDREWEGVAEASWDFMQRHAGVAPTD